jgi:hypothetical protein
MSGAAKVAGATVTAEFRICSLLHVATIEPIGSAAPGSGQP